MTEIYESAIKINDKTLQEISPVEPGKERTHVPEELRLLASTIRETSKLYQSRIVNSAKKNTDLSSAAIVNLNDQLYFWLKSRSRNKPTWQMLVEHFGKTAHLLPEEAKRLDNIFRYASHDINVTLNSLSRATDFDDEEREQYIYALDPKVIYWPTVTMEWIARLVERTPRIEQVDLSKILTSVSDYFKGYTSQDQSIQIETHIPKKLTIHGDQYGLMSAFFNMIRNPQKILTARDEPSYKGSLLIEGYQDTYGKKIVSITDNALGMPKEFLEETNTLDMYGNPISTQRAFVRGVTNGNAGGSGLGLAIAREAIEDICGGKVEAELVNYPGTQTPGTHMWASFQT